MRLALCEKIDKVKKKSEKEKIEDNLINILMTNKLFNTQSKPLAFYLTVSSLSHCTSDYIGTVESNSFFYVNMLEHS